MSEPKNETAKTVTKEPACQQQTYFIDAKDLPLSCPMDTMVLWNAHPRVFLPIEKTGKEVCPYCGACYILLEQDRGS